MDFMEAVRRRRAVRDYRSDPVSDDQLRRLIDAAIQAPSAMNEQPWRFTVIRDAVLLDRISERAKAHVLQSNAFGPLPEPLEKNLCDPGFHILYRAPVLVIISGSTGGPWATIDCALAAENMMLAACDAGLASCWIGLAQGWLGTPDGKTTVGLPVNHVPIAPIIVGHQKGETAAPPRRAPDIRWM